MRQRISNIVSLCTLVLTLLAVFPHNSDGMVYCGEHQCDDGTKCVPKQWVCDGDPDCDDLSDELDCGLNKTTCVGSGLEGTGDFLCRDQKHCVVRRWVCDGERDCQDGSDEHNCPNITCDDAHISCGMGLPCVHNSFVCDGHVNCPNGYDENPAMCQQKACNKTLEFSCTSGHQCISARWRCDGDFDCSDKSDEINCPKVTCAEGYFQCNDSQCIPGKWKCDGKFDCADSSDEVGCSIQLQPHCLSGEFMCKVSGECIPTAWKCDVDKDCEDGSDEQGCESPTCAEGEFQCRRSGGCILGSFECDGIIQCDDGSDEKDCFNMPCNNLTEFDCNSFHTAGSYVKLTGSNCIPIQKVCDGHNDCGQNEDEMICQNKNHTSSCIVNNGGCQHNCVQRLQNTYCTCHSGYMLARDGYTCHDIDECSVGDLNQCSHKCENTKGGFKCLCNTGYEPDITNHNQCYATGEEPMLLLSNRHSLREVRTRSLNYYPLLEGLRSARALDYDIRARVVFWADASYQNISKAIMSPDLQTVLSREVLVSGVRSPFGLAYDWVHSNLYYSDTELGRIEVVTLGDPTSNSQIKYRYIVHERLESPKAVVVDPRVDKRHLYWTEIGQNPRIMRSGLDGGDVKVVVEGSWVRQPLGLTLDMETDSLFWADAKLHTLSMVNLMTGRAHVIVTSFLYLRHPYALTVFEDYVYWADWQSDSILKRHKFNRSMNTTNVTTVVQLLASPTDVKVFHPLTQPQVSNACMNHRCSHICLPSSGFRPYRCVCPSDETKVTYTITNEYNCTVVVTPPSPSPSIPSPSPSSSPKQTQPTKPEVTVTSSASKSSTTVAQSISTVNGSLSDEAGNQTAVRSGSVSGVVIAVIVILVLILVLVIGYLVLLRYRKRNRKTMNFDNPVYRKRAGDSFAIEKNFQPIDTRISNQVLEPLAHSSTENIMTINS